MFTMNSLGNDLTFHLCCLLQTSETCQSLTTRVSYLLSINLIYINVSKSSDPQWAAAAAVYAAAL